MGEKSKCGKDNKGWNERVKVVKVVRDGKKE
jgi:hypothetical protein